jgi:hypothetical protein
VALNVRLYTYPVNCRGSVTFHSSLDGHRPPASFVGGEREPPILRAVLEETSTRGPLALISGEPVRPRHGQLQSQSKLVVLFRSLILALAGLIGISLWPALGVRLVHADEGRLVTIAARRFQNLTVAERRLLEYADIDNRHRGEFSVAGTSAEPKDASNDPARSASWSAQRNIRAELIRWLLVDRTAITRVDPKGISALGARIVGNLDLSHVHAERTIALVRCRLDAVNLDLAEIQSLDLSGSYATSVHADHVVSHNSMYLGWDGTDRGGDFHCSGKVYMLGARVDGELCFGGGSFQHLRADPEYWYASKKVAIDASNSVVKDDLTVCCDFEAHGAVDLDNATIGKALDGIGGRFINPDNVAISALSLNAANVIFAPGFERPSEDPEVDGVLDFTSARVETNFVVLHAKFKGRAFERHGFVGSGLDVGKAFVWKEVTLENRAFLDLRGSHLGALCDDEKSWPVPGRLLIDGLIYNGICGEEPASPTDAASRLKWLRLQPGFFPQTYRQLANWMRENGDDAGAEKILAAKAEAASPGSSERTQIASLSLKEAFVIIALAFLLSMLLVLAGSQLLRRSPVEAGGGWPTLQHLRAASEINRRRDAAARWPDSPENETKAPPITGAEATTEGERIAKSGDGFAVFRREGEFWSISYQGTTFRLKGIKGLAYIAFLLAHPGERFHVRELIARVEGVANTDSDFAAEISRELRATQELGDAGETLDQHAQGDYRRRLRELAEELVEAERFNDSGRAERIRRELEFFSGELSAALGTGGRNRRAASHVERARAMVTKNIRAGLEKIRSEEPALGRYFATSIKTGYYCAYLPDPDRKISWQL